MVYTAHYRGPRQCDQIADLSPNFQNQLATETTSLAGMDNETPAPCYERVQSVDDHGPTQHINRKMDFYLLPFLSLLYLFSGLDRSNIGNAETQGTHKRNARGAALFR
jgi:hypothetical protein